jgi:hypothetical protein
MIEVVANKHNIDHCIKYYERSRAEQNRSLFRLTCYIMHDTCIVTTGEHKVISLNKSSENNNNEVIIGVRRPGSWIYMYEKRDICIPYSELNLSIGAHINIFAVLYLCHVTFAYFQTILYRSG